MLFSYCSPHVRESGFWIESGKYLLVESGILGLGIRSTAQGIRNPTDDWNPESKILNPVIEIRNPRRGIQKQRLSWIFLHRAILFLVLLISPVVRKLKWLL